jgi:hypothetical protein
VRYLTAFVLMLAGFCVNAQTISVSAKLDSGSIRIGEQTQIHLSVSNHGKKGKLRIQWPELKDTIIGKVEIVNISKIDTTIPDKSDSSSFIQTEHITITCFDSGYYALPPMRFFINGDTTHPYETEALLFEVNNVQVDTTKAIKDIKQPLHAPFSWKEVVPYFYWLAGAVAIIMLLVYLYNRFWKRKPGPVVEKKTKIPPHVTALAELEKLRAEKLWQGGKVKQYHSRITDILRYYIESRFRIPAMEQTSDEIMYSFKAIVIDTESKSRLRQLLLLSDLVKFAKEEPLPQANELSLENAILFVNGTMREEMNETDNTSTPIV